MVSVNARSAFERNLFFLQMRFTTVEPNYGERSTMRNLRLFSGSHIYSVRFRVLILEEHNWDIKEIEAKEVDF